ncbi:hypothetical protein NEOLEDRAFT_908106 [Neolentinus lepideus HHB14362 ss-1]|uniref:Uncharacterized protein n=1 Tax=Neolentinus lepideus HHB14362 ss-1 TaxID=1314782 RepID=A0A165UJE8_9AGAM|nr:hypothetical protein NEOLEDRAFT_908106 [Neolentinus lepideus HHB14362 ss-1]
MQKSFISLRPSHRGLSGFYHLYLLDICSYFPYLFHSHRSEEWRRFCSILSCLRICVIDTLV